MTEPSPGYHGMRFYETFGDFAYIMKARVETLRDLGPALSPFNAFLFLQGLETLPCRMERHVANARAGRGVPCRSIRWSPGSTTRVAGKSRTTRWRRSTCRRAPARSSAFGVKGGREAGARFIESLRAVLAPGQRRRRQDAGHPPGQHHPPADDRRSSKSPPGVSPDLIRLSVGLEDVDDICLGSRPGAHQGGEARRRQRGSMNHEPCN